MRTGHGLFGSYFQKINNLEKRYECTCRGADSPVETVEHILVECPLYSYERRSLSSISPELDLKVLLDTSKGLEVVAKFLDKLPRPHHL